MIPVRATIVRAAFAIASLFLFVSLGACGKDNIRRTCDEPQAYQSVVAGKRIVVPDGLDPLDEMKEMPIPEAETPPRPKGAECIENAPSILKGGTVN